MVGGFAAYKARVEQQASEQVQQYYQQYRAELQQLQCEVDRTSEERDVVSSAQDSLRRLDGNPTLRPRTFVSLETKMNGTNV